jgi:transglutaminase-like putative cysteine protease
MSRRTFRASVEAPRPTAAWLLVVVASATLWITEQLDTWAVALQVLAIVGSLARRRHPFSWQRSGVALNLGMLGIVVVTISVALRGEPSTIALAHFAALTQGLQLIDARPRQTEFLLVTLSLFQVVLAANLTDSVLFPPLLIGFVFSSVWTLMVHTLRSEAIEAGGAREVNRAITPGLLRTTLLASGLSVLLALLLFILLPRLRSSVVSGAGLVSTLATAGFSDRVSLGDLGRIRQDPTVVMRIETLEGGDAASAEGYWRGLAFDRFDGTSWAITPTGRTPVIGSAEGGVSFGRNSRRVNRVQRIVREPVQAGVLFGEADLRQLHGTVRRLERDSSGGLYAVGQGDVRVRYTVSSYRHQWRDQDLRGDLARPERRLGTRYLQLPELSPEVAALARKIAAAAPTDADRVRAIEQHLLQHGRYTNVPPRIDLALHGSPIEAFLFGELAGHCEYFASAMVLLARSLGIPARLVNGFAGGRENSIGGFLEVTRSDAHSWVEVHYERAGWVRYDPTPADLRARPLVALSFSERLRELSSAMELWWFQRVVGFDRADQIQALKRAWIAWREARSGTARNRAREAAGFAEGLPGASIPWQPALWIAALAFVLAAAARWLRNRRGSALPAAYARALRLLARRGLVRSAAATARGFAAEVDTRHPGAVATAFRALTESYLAERFGECTAPSHAEELRALERGLGSRRPGR